MIMRTLTIFVLLVFFRIGVQAQAFWKYGVSYTPTLVRIDDFGPTAKHHRSGQQALLNFQRSSGDHLSFQFGVGYSFIQAQYESQIDILWTSQTSITRYRHHDLIVPIQAQFYLSTRPNRPFFAAGFMPSINIGRKVTSLSYYSNPEAATLMDVSSRQNYKRLEVLYSLGLGYDFKLKDRSKLIIQPVFRSNLPTQLFYVFRYLLNSRGGSDNETPPAVNTIGLELGYFIR